MGTEVVDRLLSAISIKLKINKNNHKEKNNLQFEGFSLTHASLLLRKMLCDKKERKSPRELQNHLCVQGWKVETQIEFAVSDFSPVNSGVIF